MAKRPSNKSSFKKGNKAAKGHSGAKGGRPSNEAKAALRDALMAERSILVGKGAKAKTVQASLRDLALMALERAMLGTGPASVKAAELTLAYTDGPPPQKIEHDGEVVVRVEYDN